MSNKLRGTRRVAMTAGVMALAAAALFGPANEAMASTAGHRGILLPGNPARSMAPATSLLSSCSAGDNSGTCNQLALTAIGRARQALEKMGGMSLSLPAFARLTPAQQLFVVVNLERAERGLAPAVVLSKSLSAIAQAGAQAGRGSNLDCRGGSAKLCWGHRDILLNNAGPKYCHGQGELAVGTGHAGRAGGYGESDTVLMAGVCGHVPTDATFTWAKAKKLLGIR
jgi:hypothetical protein